MDTFIRDRKNDPYRSRLKESMTVKCKQYFVDGNKVDVHNIGDRKIEDCIAETGNFS